MDIVGAQDMLLSLRDSGVALMWLRFRVRPAPRAPEICHACPRSSSVGLHAFLSTWLGPPAAPCKAALLASG